MTKWDLITEAERESLESIPFQNRCTGCNEWLETEADFAKHFILRNKLYPNLGDCPSNPPF